MKQYPPNRPQQYPPVYYQQPVYLYDDFDPFFSTYNYGPTRVYRPTSLYSVNLGGGVYVNQAHQYRQQNPPQKQPQAQSTKVPDMYIILNILGKLHVIIAQFNKWFQETLKYLFVVLVII